MQKAIEEGDLSPNYSDLAATFHAEEEYTKMLAGDACCFHEPLFESLDEMAIQAHQNWERFGAIIIAEHMLSSLEVILTASISRQQCGIYISKREGNK